MKMMAFLLVPVLAACGSEPRQDPVHSNDLSAAIADYAEQESPEYNHALVDLNSDGVDDAVVLMQGMEWCGSGGCTMLVLEGTDTGYSVISRSTVTREPIRMASTTADCWQDLIVHSDGAEKLLQFDGSGYPVNPSMQNDATPEQVESSTAVLP